MKEDELLALRHTIDRVDAEMARLFEKRMQTAAAIARFKKENGLRILDAGREKEILAAAPDRIADAALQSFYVRFLHSCMDLSKDYQRTLFDSLRVGFAGVRGAFAHLAAGRIFPEAKTVAFPDFASAYRAVEEGACDVCVLPLENSTAGDVGTVLDLAFAGSLFITGVYEVEIRHNLVAAPGVRLEEIRTIASHPQALAQCAPYLKRGGWELIEASNTAQAAKMVAESGRRDLAAVASREAAEEYGLVTLAEGIQEKGGNTTRFAVFSRAARSSPENDSRFFMTFTTKNEAGALARAIEVIGSHGFNLCAIRSRPTGKASWEYYFFCEGEGNPYSEEGEAMRALLKESGNELKILGTFDQEITL